MSDKKTMPLVEDPKTEDILASQALLNRKETYNLQATQDAENAYPAIAQGYPSNVTGESWEQIVDTAPLL